MLGTAPTFYLITIESELALAVEGGVYPENVTVVRKFVPPVPDLPSYPAQGMVPLGNRRILLRCFETFKEFVSVLRYIVHLQHVHLCRYFITGHQLFGRRNVKNGSGCVTSTRQKCSTDLLQTEM